MSADDASIHLVVDHVIDALDLGELPPSILRLIRRDDSIDVEATPLGDRHPSEFLVGHRLDDRYFAVGVAARGWAYRLDTDSDERTRVSVVSVVSRNGEHANATRADDPDHPVNTIDHAPTEGEQVDLMMRCLGLDTPPPPCPTSRYWNLEWLASIVDVIVAETDPLDDLTWCEVRDLHPASLLLRVGDLDPDDHDFVEMTASFARVSDWTRIRDMIDKGGYTAVGLRAGDGAWFDEGSVARYLISRLPPVEFMLGVIASGVTADARARLMAHIEPQGATANRCRRRGA